MSYGIDYGLGRDNVGADGIRFGVIPINALNEWAWESLGADYGPPTCPKCGIVLQSDDVYGDEPIGHTLDEDGIKGESSDGIDLFITSSPYYTHAQFCSPCAPGACYLLNPVDKQGPRAFCLGHDWFQNGKAPYPVFRVADGTLVRPKVKEKS